MPDYLNSKIYKIVCDITNQIYIGSTTQKLSSRLSGHVAEYKKWSLGKTKKYISSFEIIKNNNYSIILIENFQCNNNEELHKKERYFIETMVNVVNKVIPTRTKDEYIKENKETITEYKKEYYLENKDKLTEQYKQYYEDNKDKLIEQQKQYYSENKDKILEYRKGYQNENKASIQEYRKEYKKENKDKINENRKQKLECVCGSIFCKNDKSQHVKTKKHIEFIKNNPLDIAI
jgi:hypothetical protein